MTGFICHFSEETSTINVGGKGKRLGQMFRAGFNVPDGFILLPTAWEAYLNYYPDKAKIINDRKRGVGVSQRNLDSLFNIKDNPFPSNLNSTLKTVFATLQNSGYKRFAVRSSATLEDGNKASFAGQFETYLGIETFESLSDAIIKCWTSAYSDRVISYCRHNNIDPGEIQMGVVIQCEIDPLYSGVIFTANPLSGNDKEMIIELACGAGEQVVQGSVTPFRFRYNWYNESFVEAANNIDCSDNDKQDAKNISPLLFVPLIETSLEIQQFYGEPLDIEWAFANGKFHILQARPLTAINYDTPYDWTNADLKDGGISSAVTTPMMYSLYKKTFERSMPGYLRSIKVLSGEPVSHWFDWWFGYCYWNITGVKESLKKLPDFEERVFDTGLGITPSYEGKGYVSKKTFSTLFRGIKALLATNQSINNRASLCRENAKKGEEILQSLEQANYENLLLPEILQLLDDIITKHHTFVEESYFYTIYDNNNAATFFHQKLEKYKRKHKSKVAYLNLITGLSNLSHLKPAYELWDISRKALSSPFYQTATPKLLAKLYIEKEDFPLKDEIDSYLKKYGHHSYRELDISVPNWGEDPYQVMELLLAMVDMSDEANPKIVAEKQRKKYLAERGKITSRTVLNSLSRHRHLLWWREEMRDLSTRMYQKIRCALVAAGKKMVTEGMITQSDDIFFITYDELLSPNFLSNTTTLQNKILKNRIFYRSFASFNKPNEILQRRGQQERKGNCGEIQTLTGIAGSPGVVRGVARIILSVYDAHLIQQDEILVTRYTDPSFTSYFGLITALVTETGGVLSHGAVVSREYGVPAVLGLTKATETISNGDIIEVDGNEGIVTFIK